MSLTPDQEFARCVAVVLQKEGFSTYTNSPHDMGGPTKFGVTLAALSAYRGHACVAADVMNLQEDEALAIYRANYWHPIAGDQLPAGVNLMTFDCGVNQGVGHATRWLQGAAGVVQDGNIGPMTILAVQSHNPVDLLEAFKAERLASYEHDAGWATYGHGWSARDESIAALAEQWASAA